MAIVHRQVWWEIQFFTISLSWQLFIVGLTRFLVPTRTYSESISQLSQYSVFGRFLRGSTGAGSSDTKPPIIILVACARGGHRATIYRTGVRKTGNVDFKINWLKIRLVNKRCKMPQKLALKFIALKAFSVCWTSVKNYALAMNHNGVKL